ncbi:MAG TPA: ATP-binding protein [Asanoa sp.]
MSQPDREAPDLDGQLGRFRAVRHTLESSVLPLATSIDGRRFHFQASLYGLPFRLGGYCVVVDGDGRARLGQILSLTIESRGGAELDLPPRDGLSEVMRTEVTIRVARGEGVLLDGDQEPFHDAVVRPASAEHVRGWLTRSLRGRATLEIGELTPIGGVGCAVRASGFDRHTFLCGQSGSGKTYALGLILERLLLETSLRIVVLDPNSDFVRLTDLRAGVPPATSSRYAERAKEIGVYTAGDAGAHRLRLRFGDLEPAAQAALLRLDPIADREEYAELAELVETQTPRTVETFLGRPRNEAGRLALRVRNLGVERFVVWSRGQSGSVLDAVSGAERCVVVDLGSLSSLEEQALVAASVLGHLWNSRGDRAPLLVVVDEAHNVCPGRPGDPLTALATDYVVRIAAEGRKFGRYLLLSTQRPQKVHENILSQCDNLVLMRLNSAADAAFTKTIFSFVPGALVDSASTFRLGEGLVAGKISPHPALLRFGARLTEEGGADVPATWA